MQFGGIIVSTSANKTLKTTTGGTYEGWEIVYKDAGTDEIKTVAKPSQTLTQVPGLRDSLLALAVGDKFVGTMEKDGKFWKITALSKGEMIVPLPKQEGTNRWAGKAPQRDFETKEERAIRQKLITRQSSIATATEFLVAAKKTDKETLFELAEEINEWVWKQ